MYSVPRNAPRKGKYPENADGRMRVFRVIVSVV
jgi:hypothetical protein